MGLKALWKSPRARWAAGWAIGVSSLVVPPASLALLHRFPRFNVVFESVEFHVVVVSAIAFCALVAAVFTFLSATLFQTDAVRNPYELFGVERQRSAIAEPERFTRERYEALLRETDVFAYNGQVPGPTIRVDVGDRVRVVRSDRHELPAHNLDDLGIGVGLAFHDAGPGAPRRVEGEEDGALRVAGPAERRLAPVGPLNRHGE